MEPPILPPDLGASLRVGEVWPGFPVGHTLLTAQDRQYVAYYDGDRRMIVAQRRLDSVDWITVHLPENLAWDSHNGISLGLDAGGYLHLAGNMHSSPLAYYRTRSPHDVTTFERVPGMIGDLEEHVTYPEFFTGPAGWLCFGYRYGSSGRGDQVYNVYDEATTTWKRVNSGPIVSGEGLRNAYLDGPRLGPDGHFHLAWVWRDSPDCATNHDVCYARSRDLATWETSEGRPLPLPITLAASEIVDAVPTHRGLMNGLTRLGFDARNRVLLSYLKLDDRGHTQIHLARRDLDGWSTRAVTDWEGRWVPEGFGTIRFEIGLSPASADPATGHVRQPFQHARYGAHTLVLDGETLEPLGLEPEPATDPLAAWRIPHDPALQVRWVHGDDPRFALRWECLPENQDQPRDAEEIPAAGVLRVVRVR